MVHFTCDKCGALLPEMSCYKTFSFSKHKRVDLCRSCQKAHDKAIEKADAEFFKDSKKKGA